ncbi:MAG: sensitivity to high expression protein she9 [Claussenomyces sp. TS43310]|nr:MAG: sensitivity to high expression protein she9 [Claussenomyces sp. TS43310]
MQPLMRFVARPALDSITSSSSCRSSLKSPFRSAIRVVIYPPYQSLSHKRTFTDNPKHSPPTSTTPLRSEASSASSLSFPPQNDAARAPELPSAEEQRRSAISKRFSYFMDALQGNIFIASQRLNDLTGYSGIEALKTSITHLEAELRDAQDAVRSARTTYKTTVADRAASQREVTGLLARKDTWTPADLERFTNLYRSDHTIEQAVQEAATRLADAERVAEDMAAKLSTSILSRYHEEQVWSDKIRRASTWGTWGLMGVNVLMFFIFQFGFEPWRRARLVKGFEDKVKQALETEKEKEKEKVGLETLTAESTPLQEGKETEDVNVDGIVSAASQSLDPANEKTQTEESDVKARAVTTSSDMAVPAERADSASPILSEPFPATDWRRLETWRAAAHDLFSGRLVSMRMQDVTVLALESAASGAAVAGLVTLLLLRPR